MPQNKIKIKNKKPQVGNNASGCTESRAEASPPLTKPQGFKRSIYLWEALQNKSGPG
jgi:hypothetical protein